MTIHFAIVSHRHGNNLYLATTEEALRDQLYDYVSEYWDDYVDEKITDDKQACIDRYFEGAEGTEYLDDIDTQEVTLTEQQIKAIWGAYCSSKRVNRTPGPGRPPTLHDPSLGKLACKCAVCRMERKCYTRRVISATECND